MAYGFRGFSSLCAGSKAKTSLWKGVSEESCSAHCGHKAEGKREQETDRQIVREERKRVCERVWEKGTWDMIYPSRTCPH